MEEMTGMTMSEKVAFLEAQWKAYRALPIPKTILINDVDLSKIPVYVSTAYYDLEFCDIEFRITMVCERYKNKYVSLCMNDGEIIEGWLKCIDPLTGNLMLATLSSDRKQVETITFINRQRCKSLTLLDEDKEVEQFLDSLYKVEERTEKDKAEEEARKDALFTFFTQNRIPVKVEDDILLVCGEVKIHPPYEIKDCEGENSRVVLRIQGMIKKMQEALEVGPSSKADQRSGSLKTNQESQFSKKYREPSSSSETEESSSVLEADEESGASSEPDHESGTSSEPDHESGTSSDSDHESGSSTETYHESGSSTESGTVLEYQEYSHSSETDRESGPAPSSENRQEFSSSSETQEFSSSSETDRESGPAPSFENYQEFSSSFENLSM